MKSAKEHLIASLIVVFSFIVIGISVSYAFYENSVITNGDTGVSVTSGSLTMNFETLNSKIINAQTSALVKDDEIFNTEQYTAFSVSLPNDAEVDSANYTLYLTDIEMTSNFKSEYLKWALYDNNNNPVMINGNHIAGDFSNVTLTATTNNLYEASDIILNETPISINKGNSHSYKLYIWLSYSDSVLQNELLEGSLSTKVGFKGTTKNT